MDVICSHGHFVERGQCAPCPHGCLICSGVRSCQRCDSNLKINAAGVCEHLQPIVEKLSDDQTQAAYNKLITKNFDCDSCSGLDDGHKACELCLPECLCSFSIGDNAHTTLLSCKGIVFDKNFLLQEYSN